jgi:hypothetical protein
MRSLSIFVELLAASGWKKMQWSGRKREVEEVVTGCRDLWGKRNPVGAKTEV